MNAASHGPEPIEERADVALGLYSALMAARPYVERAGDRRYFGEAGPRRVIAWRVLEQVDAALADAGEWLPAASS